jgi:hypothetical protein
MTVYSLRAQALSPKIRDFEVIVWFSLLGLTVSVAMLASFGNAAMEMLAFAG